MRRRARCGRMGLRWPIREVRRSSGRIQAAGRKRKDAKDAKVTQSKKSHTGRSFCTEHRGNARTVREKLVLLPEESKWRRGREIPNLRESRWQAVGVGPIVCANPSSPAELPAGNSTWDKRRIEGKFAGWKRLFFGVDGEAVEQGAGVRHGLATDGQKAGLPDRVPELHGLLRGLPGQGF